MAKLKTNSNHLLQTDVYSKSEVDSLVANKANSTQGSWLVATSGAGVLSDGSIKYRKNTIGQVELSIAVTIGSSPNKVLNEMLPTEYWVTAQRISLLEWQTKATVLGYITALGVVTLDNTPTEGQQLRYTGVFPLGA